MSLAQSCEQKGMCGWVALIDDKGVTLLTEAGKVSREFGMVLQMLKQRVHRIRFGRHEPIIDGKCKMANGFHTCVGEMGNISIA